MRLFKEAIQMLDIAMPKIEVVQAAENYGRFKIEPLDPG
jgi:DNA-directed RNA polymerase subunit alpha